MYVEYHNLCDNCGDLLVEKTEPQPYQSIYCPSCGTLFPDGLGDIWRKWPDPSKPDWAGCA